jgi:hypothetical protein
MWACIQCTRHKPTTLSWAENGRPIASGRLKISRPPDGHRTDPGVGGMRTRPRDAERCPLVELDSFFRRLPLISLDTTVILLQGGEGSMEGGTTRYYDVVQSLWRGKGSNRIAVRVPDQQSAPLDHTRGSSV